jgi:serine/threonine protein kinase
VQGFAGFLRPLLAYDPAQRPSAAEMLRHPWLQQQQQQLQEDGEQQQEQ